MTIHPGKLLGVACAVVLGASLTACGASETGARPPAHHGGHAAPPAAGGPPAPEATEQSIDQLGAALGCPRPDVQVDAEELRQAACQTSSNRATLVTFATGKGQRDWLDAAQPYGGSYLVGERWVVVSEPPVLESLRTRLGGRIESTRHH
ncbi:hypothetical protein OUY22_01765 [Nonomuraea sp. MCN248]|uniref:Lipoprotein n=1 Tax=Nonomuraea corallina TaxID=2989783 RepID=A0ABT4S4I4_9ACTN|nr:hypothetical protein [Nonomuraea corallina]MDA0632127.1 hypothetical protein [Nonomuraea corallina]